MLHLEKPPPVVDHAYNTPDETNHHLIFIDEWESLLEGWRDVGNPISEYLESHPPDSRPSTSQSGNNVRPSGGSVAAPSTPIGKPVGTKKGESTTSMASVIALSQSVRGVVGGDNARKEAVPPSLKQSGHSRQASGASSVNSTNCKIRRSSALEPIQDGAPLKRYEVLWRRTGVITASDLRQLVAELYGEKHSADVFHDNTDRSRPSMAALLVQLGKERDRGLGLGSWYIQCLLDSLRLQLSSDKRFELFLMVLGMDGAARFRASLCDLVLDLVKGLVSLLHGKIEPMHQAKYVKKVLCTAPEVSLAVAQKAVDYAFKASLRADQWSMKGLKKVCAQLKISFPCHKLGLDHDVTRLAAAGMVNVDALLYLCVASFREEEARIMTKLEKAYLIRRPMKAASAASVGTVAEEGQTGLSESTVDEKDDDYSTMLSFIKARLTVTHKDKQKQEADRGGEGEGEEEDDLDAYDPEEWKRRVVDQVRALAGGQSDEEKARKAFDLAMEDIDGEINQKWRDWPWSTEWEWGGLQVADLDGLEPTRKYSLL